jgi:hypothetical protein
MSHSGAVVYRVNPDDQIIYFDEGWDRFARENDGLHLVGSRILDRTLWDFIGDVATEHIYRDLLREVRTGREISFPFRCDSPATRRLLLMRIYPCDPSDNETLEFSTAVISSEPRPAVELPRGGTGESPVVRACGWCKRVETEGAWVEVETALERLRLFELPTTPRFTHGICPDCLHKMTEYLGWRIDEGER